MPNTIKPLLGYLDQVSGKVGTMLALVWHVSVHQLHHIHLCGQVSFIARDFGGTVRQRQVVCPCWHSRTIAVVSSMVRGWD